MRLLFQICKKTMDDPDAQLSQAAQETLSGLQGKETDAVIIKMVESGDTKHRLAGMDMVERRRDALGITCVKNSNIRFGSRHSSNGFQTSWRTGRAG